MRWLETRVPPVALVLVTAAGMWLLSRAFPAFSYEFPGRYAVPSVLLVAGVVLVLAGLAQFRKARTTVDPTRPQAASALVKDGIYRWTRNPMYLGFAVLLLGWAVYLASPPSAIALACFVLYMNRFQIVPEERALQERFGSEFAEYRLTVRRWL